MKSHFELTGRLGRKINIYRKTNSGLVYVCSTDWHKRCKDARFSVARDMGYPQTELVARFAR